LEVVQREEMAAMQRWYTSQINEAQRALSSLTTGGPNGSPLLNRGPSAGTLGAASSSSSSHHTNGTNGASKASGGVAATNSLAARQQAATVVISSMPEFAATVKI
jgi:hypothetical protein